MKPILIIILVWTMLWALAPAQITQPPVEDAIKNWQTVRIVYRFDAGDHQPPSPFILLQRLDTERIVLSTDQNESRLQSLPVARAIITTNAAQTLIDRTLAFYSRAQKETGEKAKAKALPLAERDAIYSKFPFGISASYIRIEILGTKDQYVYEDDFSDGSVALKEFRDFVIQQSK